MKKPKDTAKSKNIEKEPWEREPWEQLDHESDKAYGAFQTYLNLGMGHRTYVAAAEKLGKRQNYEAALRRWATKYQWRARCQAYDAAQLEKQRDAAEDARLEVYATGYSVGSWFFNHVSADLKRRWENQEPDGTGPYQRRTGWTIAQEIKLMDWGYEMAVKNAVEKRDILLRIGSKALKDDAFAKALDEVIAGDPKLHDAYIEIISKALQKVNGLDRDDIKKEKS